MKAERIAFVVAIVVYIAEALLVLVGALAGDWGLVASSMMCGVGFFLFRLVLMRRRGVDPPWPTEVEDPIPVDWLEEAAETDDVILEIKKAVEAQHPEWASKKPALIEVDDPYGYRGFRGSRVYEKQLHQQQRELQRKQMHEAIEDHIEERLLKGYQYTQPKDEAGVRKWAHDYEKARQEAVLRQQDIADEARHRQRKLSSLRKQPLLPIGYATHNRWPDPDYPLNETEVATIRERQRRAQQLIPNYESYEPLTQLSVETIQKM
jgi:hypothetical protein